MEDLTPPHWRDDDIDDVVERLTVYGDVPVTIILEVISAISAALTQSRAETAAAYERAAEWYKDHVWFEGVDEFGQGCMNVDVQTRIRALATPDQSSALAAIEAAAEARGMRMAVGIVNADVKKLQPEMTRRAQRLAAAKAPGFKYAIHRADLDARISCRDKILAAIPQGEV